MRGAAHPSLVEAARLEVRRRATLEPPPAGHAGPYSYFIEGDVPRPLRSLLFEGRALSAGWREFVREPLSEFGPAV